MKAFEMLSLIHDIIQIHSPSNTNAKCILPDHENKAHSVQVSAMKSKLLNLFV